MELVEREELSICDDLEVRTINVLKSQNIFYLDELVKVKQKDILSWRNCGSKTLRDILYFLKKRNLNLSEPSIHNEYLDKILYDAPSMLRDIQRKVESSEKSLKKLSENIYKAIQEIESLDKKRG